MDEQLALSRLQEPQKLSPRWFMVKYDVQCTIYNLIEQFYTQSRREEAKRCILVRSQ